MAQELSQGGPVPGASRTSLPIADNSLAEALITFRKQRWVLVSTILLGIFYGLYRGWTQPKLYEAIGRIQVRAGSANEYKLNSVVSLGAEDAQTKMQSEVAIVQSDTLLTKVAGELNLAGEADFWGKRQPAASRTTNDAGIRQAVIKILQLNLKVTLVPKTDIIRISYSSLSGRLSAEIVNTVIADYIQRSYETRFASTQRVSDWLSGQLDDLKRKVETSQERMMDLQRKLGVLGFDQSHNQIASSIDDLAKAAGQAELARIIAESRYRLLSGMDLNAMEGSIDTSPGAPPATLNTLRAQLATARANYALMLGTLGVNHPRAKSLKAEIDELAKEVGAEQNRLLVQAKENFLLARENQDQTHAALEAEKTAAYKLRNDLVEYTLRQREFESNRTLYEGLLQKLRTAGVEAGLESREIDIVDQAVVPASPKLESKVAIFLTSVAIATIAGILLAFLLESLDTGLRGIAEIEMLTELPSLGIIPNARKTVGDAEDTLSLVRQSIFVLRQPKSQLTEAFRSLRTSLLLATTSGRAPRLILVTSATPSEGKTTVSINLATVLAQGGTPVLLIDADLRRPSIHHRLGLSAKAGLSTILSGGTTLESSLQHVAEVPNLHVLTSGPVPPFAAEMLSSSTMALLLREVTERFTHVVLDSPPILSVTDGVILARQMDTTLLVVRHGRSNKHAVRRARDLLLRSGALLAGLVVNAVDMNSPEYYGYYGYSGYAYGKADSEASGKERGRG